MKSSYKILIAGLAVALLAAVGVAATVHHGHMREHGRFGDHLLRMATRQLNLTDAQQQQMKDIIAKEKPSFRPLAQQMMQSRQQMMALVTSGNFDEAKARDIASQQSQSRTEMEVQQARVASELFQVLTPDQKAKAVQLIQEHQQRWQQRMQQAPSTGQSQNQ